MITATATFTPGPGTERLLDLYVRVKVFAKVKAAQQVVVDEAKLLAPVVTGDLVSKISAGEIQDDGLRVTGQVVSESDHAAFVEFGTGLTGSGTYPFELPQEGVPITGSWVYDYKRQNWKGMAAQPYLRPALDLSRDKVLAEFKA